MSSLAAAIRSIREASGQTQQEFSATLKVTNSMVSKYEKGLATPGFPILAKLLALAGTEKSGEALHVVSHAMADLLGTDLDGVRRMLVDLYRQQGERLQWRSLVGGEISGNEALADAVSDPLVQAVIRYRVDFHDQPQMLAHLSEVVRTLQSRRAQQAQFMDLSQKEVEQVEDLVYLMRHGDPGEVRDMVRRASSFRRQIEESERKRTLLTKKSRADHR